MVADFTLGSEAIAGDEVGAYGVGAAHLVGRIGAEQRSRDREQFARIGPASLRADTARAAPRSR